MTLQTLLRSQAPFLQVILPTRAREGTPQTRSKRIGTRVLLNFEASTYTPGRWFPTIGRRNFMHHDPYFKTPTRPPLFPIFPVVIACLLSDALSCSWISGSSLLPSFTFDFCKSDLPFIYTVSYLIFFPSFKRFMRFMVCLLTVLSGSHSAQIVISIHSEIISGPDQW